MSAKLMGLVFELDISGDELPIMLALADHARDDGTSVYPSVGYLAWKTNRSERSIQRALRALEDRGLIETVGHEHGGRGRAREYVLHIEKGVKKSPYQPNKGRQSVTVSSTKRVTPVAKRVTDTTQKGDTHVTPTISEPLENRKEGIPTSSPRPIPINRNRERPVYNAILRKWRPGKTWRDLTLSEQSLVGKIASELESVGATPEQVEAAWDIWPRAMPRMRSGCTPPLLAQYWGDLQDALVTVNQRYDPTRYREVVLDNGQRGYIEI